MLFNLVSMFGNRDKDCQYLIGLVLKNIFTQKQLNVNPKNSSSQNMPNSEQEFYEQLWKFTNNSLSEGLVFIGYIDENDLKQFKISKFGFFSFVLEHYPTNLKTQLKNFNFDSHFKDTDQLLQLCIIIAEKNTLFLYSEVKQILEKLGFVNFSISKNHLLYPFSLYLKHTLKSYCQIWCMALGGLTV